MVSNKKILARLTMPIAGLMSDAPTAVIIDKQRKLLEAAKKLGVKSGSDPFVTLSFVALPVIPEVRLTDMGVFDVLHMKFADSAKAYDDQ